MPVISYSYDTASRLSYIDNQTGNGQHKYSYMYDNVGNRWSMMITDSGGVRTHVYSYDNIYQITDVNYPAELSYLATDTTFTYDEAGNRSSVIDGSGTCSYTSNNLNQYTAAGSVSYTYDDSGNMTADGQYTYTYDPENRLTQVVKPNPPAQQLNSFAAYTKGGDAVWVADGSGFAKSGSISDDQESWMYIDVSGPGTVQFQWKVSSQLWCDCLKFTVDGVNRGEISGQRNWQQETYTLTGTGSHRLQWRYYKDSSEYAGDDCGYVKAVTFTPPALPAPDYLAQAVDSELAFTTGGLGPWQRQTGSPSYYDGDCAQSGGISDGDESWMQTTVAGAGTVTFWWKVSSESGCDCLEFYLDNQLQNGRISGEVDWTQKSYTITGAGPHTLKWRYVKDGSSSFGEDCGWVDWVQWSGPLPEPAADAWATLNYFYDAGGRRIEKWCDGRTITKYVYDGDHCLAEYDAGGNLRRKYIYGPCVDEPICMIEAAASYAGTYYYHFDALGSVVALTNSSGNTVEVYEYDVYGRVGASDPNHPNRFLFTGREFDKETGLYYYRARYYNPQIGRFLQTDPVGYKASMNLYCYCCNDPADRLDPFGRTSDVSLVNPGEAEYVEYTGQWDIVNGDLQPGGRRTTERVERGANAAKWIIRIAGVANIAVPVIGEAGDAAAGAADVGADILETAAQMLLEAMDSCDIPGYYRGYIRLKGYKAIPHPWLGDWLGSIIWGDYECVWTKWVEVSGGEGYDNGVGSYDTWSHAFEAIHEAIPEYTNPRPGYERDEVGPNGVVSTEGT